MDQAPSRGTRGRGRGDAHDRSLNLQQHKRHRLVDSHHTLSIRQWQSRSTVHRINTKSIAFIILIGQLIYYYKITSLVYAQEKYNISN